MTGGSGTYSVRATQWWARRYTSGLPRRYAATRLAEIRSDLHEHELAREADGWTRHQIGRERVRRLLTGMGADMAWRHEILHRDRPRAQFALRTATALATLGLAAFYFAFAAYLLGNKSLADQRLLGGFTHYADEVGRPVASPLAAAIIATLGVILVIATVARPVSPVVSNIATAAVTSFGLLFFWLGIWPAALVAATGSIVDFAIRGTTGPSTH